MNRIRAVVQSMTPYERENPDVISQSRRKRIAAGCGQPLNDINQLIKQFNQSREMMKQMSNGRMGGLNKMMGRLNAQGGMKGPAMEKMKSPEQIKKEQNQKQIARLLKKNKRKKR